jgi:hypothetical protein
VVIKLVRQRLRGVLGVVAARIHQIRLVLLGQADKVTLAVMELPRVLFGQVVAVAQRLLVLQDYPVAMAELGLLGLTAPHMAVAVVVAHGVIKAAALAQVVLVGVVLAEHRVMVRRWRRWWWRSSSVKCGYCGW